MSFDELKDKKVAILGFGLEGISMVEYFLKHNIPFSLLDEKNEKDFPVVDEKWKKALEKMREHKIPLLLGKEFSTEILSKFDVLVKSPGISPHKEYIRNLPSSTVITSLTKLFFDNCPAKIIGVTGTKGKGTTSSLIYEMLKKGGFDAYLGGNIGKPPLDFLDILTPQSIVVLEMSSFQLQDLEKSPHISVMLMVTSEHLDYHSSTQEYREAKRNIIKWQNADDMAVLNVDYPGTRESADKTPAKLAWVSRYQEVEEGCFVRDGKVILRVSSGGPATRHPAPMASFTYVQSRNSNGVPTRVTPNVIASETRQSTSFEYKVIDVNGILLPGGHNLENVCAATMAAYFAGVSIPDIAFVLKTFKGLEHRLELVREINGVRYYDDSFSTVPETAVAAISAFTSPEILILGGSSKNSDFTELGKTISTVSNIKAIIGIGVEWERIKESVKQKALSVKYIEGLRDMKSIVKKAHELAQPGDVVLLSPACASFDMFANYKDRGNQFKEQVNLL